MAKFFATIIYVIDAESEGDARGLADNLVESPDCPEFIESAWVDHIEEVEEVEADWVDDEVEDD